MKSGNRRVVNATSQSGHGKDFKSKLELVCWETLREHGFRPEYESVRLVIWKGFRPSVPFMRNDRGKSMKEDMKKLLDITYTPDFIVRVRRGVTVYIEAKGWPNDVYNIKRKLFRKWLEEQPGENMFFEVHSKRGLEQAIRVIKEKYYGGNGKRKEEPA